MTSVAAIPRRLLELAHFRALLLAGAGSTPTAGDRLAKIASFIQAASSANSDDEQCFGAFDLPHGVARPSFDDLERATQTLVSRITRADGAGGAPESLALSLVDELLQTHQLVGVGAVTRASFLPLLQSGVFQPDASPFCKNRPGIDVDELLKDDGRVWHVSHLAVLPSAQSLGHGSTLFRSLRRHAQSKEGRLMWATHTVPSNSDRDGATQFCETVGFDLLQRFDAKEGKVKLMVTDIVKAFSCPSSFC